MDTLMKVLSEAVLVLFIWVQSAAKLRSDRPLLNLTEKIENVCIMSFIKSFIPAVAMISVFQLPTKFLQKGN